MVMMFGKLWDALSSSVFLILHYHDILWFYWPKKRWLCLLMCWGVFFFFFGLKYVFMETVLHVLCFEIRKPK